jgi:hypothetical protein
VRRASDSAEQDIGFTSGGDLDTTSLATFCSGTDGFVKVWYDQAGANDATQISTGSQPQIVSNGSVLTDSDGNPHVDFDGTSSHLNTTISTISQPFTSFQVVKGDVLGTVAFIYSATSSTVSLLYVNTNVIRINAGTNLDSAAIRDTNQVVLSAVFNGASSATYKNGSSVAAGNTGTNSLSNLIIASPSFASQRFDGKIQELVIYPSNQDAAGNRTGIESNINTYYSLYP